MTFEKPALVAAAFAAAIAVATHAGAAMPVAPAVGVETAAPIVQVAKKKRMTRKQEVDKSVESGTVPKRYRNSVPKEYQQYVPFSK